ncbi:MAG: molybdopterin molybdotransferase MoeA [Rhodospirillales bacterium]|nr:molybdopterin molybdotransferase MoeA [Rhodospirillales bacterium]
MVDLNDCFAAAAGRLTIAEAMDRFISGLDCVVDVEDVAVAEAVGRILNGDVVSDIQIPPQNNSAVDGYLVCLDDLEVSGDTRLPLAGRIAAGHPLKTKVLSGQAYEIFTGAQVPAGQEDRRPDTIFMVENVKAEDGYVILPPGQTRGANLRLAGEDVELGDTVLRAGTVLRPQDIGMAASVGRTHLTVRQKLRVAVFSTGDEIRDPGDALEPGTIYDINRFTVPALLTALGCSVTDLGIYPDSLDTIQEGLAGASHDHDLILTSGGVSKGEEDHVRTAVEGLGALHTWNLLIKPGRPIALGHIDDAGRQVPFIGLPGNPVAVMVTFLKVARPIVQLLSGARDLDQNLYQIPAGFTFIKKPGRREWLRCRLEKDGAGRLCVIKYPHDGSGILTSMVASDGLVELAENSAGVTPGQLVDFLPFNEVM